MAHLQAIPGFFYGTAWKEEKTESLVRLALKAGFRAFDTANQRKHYYEEGLGAGIRDFIKAQSREALFLQSKFTYRRGQDHRLPYDPNASLSIQVEQSFHSSLQHLGISYLDSYLLHGPELAQGLSVGDWEVWRAMEQLQQAGKTLHLGISNCSASQLKLLLAGARVRPTFVQNRCYASTGWDRETRELCQREGLHYQGFSLLTANREFWMSHAVITLARREKATPAQVIFRFARLLHMIPLTGTSDLKHMEADLACDAVSLSKEDLQSLHPVRML
jgi:diketogulonate reductase-like aldo/keto reductase